MKKTEEQPFYKEKIDKNRNAQQALAVMTRYIIETYLQRPMTVKDADAVKYAETKYKTTISYSSISLGHIVIDHVDPINAMMNYFPKNGVVIFAKK